MSARAQDQSDSVVQKLASHTYVIPRSILDMVYLPDYSKVANPNPNWPHEAVIRLYVGWPDFGAPSGPAFSENTLTISLGSLEELPITPIDEIIKNMAKAGWNPAFDPAEYNLVELRSSLNERDTTREFIAETDQGGKFLIRCHPPKPGYAGGCQFNAPYEDLQVNVSFWWIHLKEWKRLYEKTVSLIDSIRKD